MAKDRLLNEVSIPSTEPAPSYGVVDCLTLADFCRVNRMSLTHFYTLKRAGKGPREMQGVGRRVLITPEANQAWREARERDAEQAAEEEPTGDDLAALLAIAAA